jgi:hypothetical protein
MSNNKVGLSYYNVDTDRYINKKIKRLKHVFGCSGIAVYDYILCEIYRVKGCFLEWDASTAFDVAEYFGLKESLVNEIVSYCGTVGLFDKALLTCGSVSNSTQEMNRCGMVWDSKPVPTCVGVITSKSIQSRYIEICNYAKRKNINIPEKYRIIDEPSEGEQSKTTEVCPKTTEVCREVKKSKVKKSKCAALSARSHENCANFLQTYENETENPFPERIKTLTERLNAIPHMSKINLIPTGKTLPLLREYLVATTPETDEKIIQAVQEAKWLAHKHALGEPVCTLQFVLQNADELLAGKYAYVATSTPQKQEKPIQHRRHNPEDY